MSKLPWVTVGRSAKKRTSASGVALFWSSGLAEAATADGKRRKKRAALMVDIFTTVRIGELTS